MEDGAGLFIYGVSGLYKRKEKRGTLRRYLLTEGLN